MCSLGSLHDSVAVPYSETPPKENEENGKEQEARSGGDDHEGLEELTNNVGLEASTAFSLIGVN